MRKFAVFLEKLPPGADVLLTAGHHLALSRTSLTSDSMWLELLESRWILAKLQHQYALHMLVSANEGGPEDSDVGDHSVRTDLLLMTLAAVPIRCSPLSVSRANQRPVTHGCRS